MDRLFQWLWDRHGPNYAWALFVTCYLVPFPIYLFLAFAVVASEHSDRYLAAAGGTSVAMAILAFGIVLPGIGPLRTVQRVRESIRQQHWKPRTSILAVRSPEVWLRARYVGPCRPFSPA